MTDFAKGIENQLAVTAGTLGTAAPAFLNELGEDIKSGKAAATVAISAPIGLGTKVLLNNSPVAMKAVLVVGAIGFTAYEMITQGKKVTDFYGSAWDANTEAQRNQLSNSGGLALGKSLATLTEASVGLGIGNLAGRGALALSPRLQDLALATTSRVEYAARTMLPEKTFFNVPGSKRLGPEYISEDRTINLAKLATDFREPWQGVERARAFDITTRRASVSLPGTKDSAYMGFPDRADMITMHTHPPGRSAFPSRPDLFTSDSLNMIHGDKGFVIYRGQRPEWQAAVKRAEETLKARSSEPTPISQKDIVERALRNIETRREMLVINDADRSAFIQRSAWVRPTRQELRLSQAARGGWRDAEPIHLDYQSAIQTISSFRQGSATDFSSLLQRIQTTAAVSKPGG